MNLRRAQESDFVAMWPIFQAVIVTGNTYNFAPDTDRQTAFEYWFDKKAVTYVAEQHGVVWACIN